MSGSLAKYHARSPRYVLNTLDNSLVRFSGAERFSWEEKTELMNISLSGLSFTAPLDLSPQLGEVIKIQFEVPGSEMMACFGIVTRIQQTDQYENEIATHFYKLDRIQRINLVQGLAKKLDTKVYKDKKSPESFLAREQSQENQNNFILYFSLMFISLMTWLIVIKLYWMF